MNRLQKAAELDVIKHLNEDLKGEHGAISQYEEHIKNIDNSEIKKVLTHIMEEEKQHVKELTDLIKKYSI